MVDEMQGVKGRMGPVVEREETEAQQCLRRQTVALMSIQALAFKGKVALLDNDRERLGKVLVEIYKLAGGETR